MPLIKFLLKRKLHEYATAVLIAAMISPLLILIFRPERDLVYHLKAGASETINEKNHSRMRDNIFAHVEGRVDTDSVRLISDPTGTHLQSCTFRLSGFPEHIVLCSREGALFELLKAAFKSAKSEKLIDEEKGRVRINFKSEWYGKEVPEGVRKILSETQNFSGRVYSSKGRLFVFDTFYYRKQLKIEDYLDTQGGTFALESDFSKFVTGKRLPLYDSGGIKTCYLLVIGEKPSLSRLIDTNAGLIIFITAATIIIVVIGRLARQK